jgi:hypothetical protein
VGSLRSLKIKIEGDGESPSPLKFTQKELMILTLGATLEDELSSTHLQKYLFLLVKGLRIPKDQGFSFRQGGYGPSPEPPYNTILKDLEKEGLLKGFDKSPQGSIYHYYRLSKSGRSLYKEMRKTLPTHVRRWLNELTEYFQTHDFKQIVCAVCNAHPEWQDGCLFYSRRNYGNP